MVRSKKSLLLVLIQFSCIAIIAVYAGVRGTLLQNLTTIAAFLLGIWAIGTMRFSVNIFPDVRQRQALFTSGPYRYIRHPMYTAVLLATLAWSTNRLDILSLFVWLALVVTLLIKISHEEKLLTNKFNNYRLYQQKTKKLIPYVY